MRAKPLKNTVLLLPRLLIPVRPGLQVLENMAVAVNGDLITAVLPRADAIEKFPEAEQFELTEHVLLPGFINMHTHSAMSLLRGYADDMNLQVWLKDYIWPVEKAWLCEDFVHDGTMLSMAEMLRGGTSCFNDLYFYPEITARAAIETGMRASIGIPVVEFPTSWAANADEYIDKGLEVSAAWEDEALITTTFAPHAPYTVGDHALARIASLSEAHNMPVHMHLLESRWEVEESLKQHRKTPLERLHDLGLMNERLLAVHMTQLDDAGVLAVADAGVNVIHCPESNLKLGAVICPVSRLLEQGVNLALGTDGAASNNDLDILGECRTAALLAKGAVGDPCVLDAFQALEMLTINAAKALGQEHRIGSIEVGKLADMCAINLDSLRTTPMYDVVSHLIYAASSQQVSHLWVGGRLLLAEGEFTCINESDIKHRANNWAHRITMKSGVAGAQT